MNSTSSSRDILIRGLIVVALVLPFCPAAAPGAETVSGNTVETLALVDLQRLIRESEKRLLVVVMAAWCHPCIRELPDLDRIYQQYRTQGLEVLGISLDLEGPRAIQPIIDRLNVRFPVYWVGEAAIEAFQIRGIPLLMFVQRGEVVERVLGKRSPDYLEKKIEEFLR